MTRTRLTLAVIPLALTGALFLGSCEAPADGLVTMPVRDPLVKKECGACHMVYPPGLLPGRSWAAIAGSLADHFGENAELDVEQTKAISDYLVANAADARGGNNRALRDLKADVTPTRITEMPWWLRRHNKKDRTSPKALARAGAKFKGDCKACHQAAEKGVFDDD